MKTTRNNMLTLSAVGLMLGAATTPMPSKAETFRFAYQSDVQSLDPHALSETFTLGFLGNVYEGLVAYGPNLEVVPALAESWENTGPTTWVFNLRQGVTFHNGNAFTADDVIFTWERALGEGSDMKLWAGKIANITKIDDHTVEIETPSANPILPREFVFLYMMDKDWSEANNATRATGITGENAGNFANHNTNGTGPFVIAERTVDVKTVLEPWSGYWRDLDTNVDRIDFTPIGQDATRVAALISGELDLAFPVPVQDWQRLEAAKGVSPLTGAEARTIYIGMDQFRDELLYSNVNGANPFKDQRVRQAIAHALNLEAIRDKIMRGAATPSGMMIAPQVNGYDEELGQPYAFDTEMSKALLAEAGYPDGFEVTLDCPNDRYVNDEQICLAVASMLAQVGVKVDVLAQPRSKFFAKILEQSGYDTSMYLMGWTPSSIDAHNVLSNLIMCRRPEDNHGIYNLGDYCNARVDELAIMIEGETDQAKRSDMILEAFTILKDEVGYLPIHQQPLSWGVRDGVQVNQRADNVLDLRFVRIR